MSCKARHALQSSSTQDAAAGVFVRDQSEDINVSREAFIVAVRQDEGAGIFRG